MGEKIERMHKLRPELEAEFPEQIKIFRQWYFSHSEEELERLHKNANRKFGTPHGCKAKEHPSKTKYCFECGKKINREANFCECCGIKQPEIG